MLGKRLVIGLDYGTTYTGVAYCETSDTKYDERRIQVVQDWPACHTMIGTKEKVPSEITYVEDGVRWGSLIPPHVQRYMWTKLELEGPQTGEAQRIREELSTPAGYVSSPAVNIVAAFLAQIKKHLIINLDTHYGVELWRTLPITLVVTVPAVWSDAAKDRTLQAVRMAGFNQQQFPMLRRTVTTTEPEAAALYTLKSMNGSVRDEQLAVGDGFVVCDMGGGTVDLISYRVSSIEPTVVEEATIGTGDQCGGSFVDREFLKWLEGRLGVADFVTIAGCRADLVYRTCLPTKLARMVQEFSLTAKSGFSGQEEYYLRLPAPLSAIEDETRGMCDGEIRLEPFDMMRIFEFSLHRTLELVSQQVQQARDSGKARVKYVFMVGGFAESPYVYRQVKVDVEKQDIRVVKPAYAWSAVVRGAAAKGLESDGRTPIKYRRCRRHYGVSCNRPFQENQHRKNDAFFCDVTGIKKARNQADWLIKKGQELSTSAKLHGKLMFYWVFRPNTNRTVRITVLASDADVAPLRSTHKSVYKVAELIIDLSSVPKKQFVREKDPHGNFYYKLSYEVHVSVQSSLEFSLVVNGTTYGSVQANYA